MKAMKWLVVAGLLAGCASGPQAGPASPPRSPDRVSRSELPAAAEAAALGETSLTREVLAGINRERQARGAAPLAPDANLQRIAAIHSADMALRDFFGHHNPDGQSALERALAVDADFTGRIAENIYTLTPPAGASAQDTAGKIVRGWVNSPSHRKTLKSPDYDRTGIGVAFKGRAVYITQVFAGP